MQPKKIMICDDDRGILEMLELFLELEGYNVICELNSTHLTKQLISHKPDLLLLDLWMPIISGDQLIKIIRSTPEIKETPIIVLSASVDGPEIAGNLGANGFIAKPFDLTDITDKINSILKN
ncbi:response regulator [Sphingobacterium siyangense]|uniref:response regulator n=1 Tax=Sphingobacterium siyangense TaxID=459529 RepID=UPI00191B4913|nr:MULTISPECIES: response regulator [Sphingobacterium]QQT32923.1 response regulator [Sphingobacterium multivorum]